MTSSVTAFISYPIIAIAIAVVGGRILVLSGTQSSRRVTAAVAALTISALLREGEVQHFVAKITADTVDVQLVRQLSTAFLMLTMVPLVAMGARWVFGYRSESWGRYIYTAAGVSVALLIVVGANARDSDRYIDISPGRETIIYFAVFSLWTATMATLYLYVSVRELKRGYLPRRFVLMFVALGLLSLWGVEETLSIMTSAIFAGTDHPNAFVHWRVAANETNMIFILLAAALYAAVPLTYRLAETIGVDHWSRSCRKLTPMWRDLTVACPEVLLSGGPVPSTSRQRVHRMCIEMRDALSVLARFNSPSDVGLHLTRSRISAIAEAIDAKRAGVTPTRFRSFELPSARSLDGEVDVLRVIAKQWVQARSDKTLMAAEPIN
ncbi:DUF6545 domain-containing protein [Rhodococcus sp. NPDC057297]|uniref:DUF6545 domain-containing protein n=1 Tax=Rhodococcus sp. NPDC057297 TaxID=3346090 RepID=UPI003631BD37